MSDGRSDFRIKCVTWNVHSLTNKVDEVMEHILDKKADIVFLTEIGIICTSRYLCATEEGDNSASKVTQKS